MRETYDEYLEQNAANLDITPTMFSEATDHYKAVAKTLANNGVVADFYAQGSFATGTVVRPYRRDEDDYFDLDVVGKRTDVSKEGTTPELVWNSFKDALTSSERYAGMLEECEECFTINYAVKEGQGGFKLDVVAAVAEHPDTQGDPIALARKGARTWLPSNPKGLAEWFMTINSQFIAVNVIEYRNRAFKANREAYQSIEEVPEHALRTSLQRTVQILKRSRDVYCLRSGIDPFISSCALMTLVATLADDLSHMVSISDMLRQTTGRMLVEVDKGLDGKNGLLSSNGTWFLNNPVSDGNLIDGWTDTTAKRFRKWLVGLREHLLIDPVKDPRRFNESIRSIFGAKAKVSERNSAPAITITQPMRPWSC